MSGSTPSRVPSNAAEDSRGRPDLAEYLALATDLDDEVLGTLIEVDGRLRLAEGLAVTLDRYLLIVPGLADKPAALDAAIEAALRGLAASGCGADEAADRLIAAHPALREPIRATAELNKIFLSTDGHRRMLTAAQRELPSDFGEPRADDSFPYRLIEVVGRGASAIVYKAIDLGLSDSDALATVAVKVFPDSSGHIDAVARQDEARKARRVDHPHVARVLHAGVAATGESYIVYEFVEGGNLHDRIAASGPLSERDAARMVVMIARGLQAAHSAGVVHCDLKPANILIGPDGMPRITDFGSSRRITGNGGPRRSEPPSDPAAGGTIAFMAPEQFHMEAAALDPPVDLYGLGGILRFCLTGRPPNGTGGKEIAEAFLGGGLRAIDKPGAWDGIDPDLAAIAVRAMDRDPSRRFASPAEMAGDLESFLAGEPVRWTRPSLARRTRLFLRRNRARVVVGAAAFLLISAASGVALRSFLQLEAKRQADAVLVESLGRAGQSVRSISADGFMAQELMLHWAMVSVFAHDPRVPADLMRQFWSNRHAWGERVAARYAEADRGGSLEARMWEVARALWLLDAGKPREARQLIESGAPFWTSRLEAEDPWRAAVAGLGACARADLLLSGDAGGSDDRLRAAAALEESLRRAAEGVALLSDALLFRYRFNERRERLLGTEWLNRPEEAERLRREQNELQERLHARAKQ